MKFFLLTNVKMPTIVDILTSMSRINNILGLPGPEIAEFLDIFILISIYNFMLSRVEHGKSFITLGPDMIKILLKLQTIKSTTHPSTLPHYEPHQA